MTISGFTLYDKDSLITGDGKWILDIADLIITEQGLQNDDIKLL